MNQTRLNVQISQSVSTFKKDFEKMQKANAYYPEEVQEAVNRLGLITLKALENIEKALTSDMD